MRVSRWVIAAAVAALAAALVVGARSASGDRRRRRRRRATRSALVTDVGGFNDNGFNKNQLVGPQAAAKTSSASTARSARLALVERLRAELQRGDPQTARSSSSRPASCSATRLKRRREAVPEHQVRDHRRPGAARRSAGMPKNERRASRTRRRRRGCLVGVLAAEDGARGWAGKIDRRGRRHQDPAGRLYIAGYQYCAKKAVPGTKVARSSTRTGLRRPGEVRGDGAERDRPRARR